MYRLFGTGAMGLVLLLGGCSNSHEGLFDNDDTEGGSGGSAGEDDSAGTGGGEDAGGDGGEGGSGGFARTGGSGGSTPSAGSGGRIVAGAGGVAGYGGWPAGYGGYAGYAGYGGAAGASSWCGNGVVENGEQCDGWDLGGERCVTLGYGEGLLSCYAESCTYDVSMCSRGSLCGDGIRTGSEQCDGADLGNASCVTLGYEPGILSCYFDVCMYDVSMCGRGGFCGDGVLDDEEDCDGENIGAASCESLGFDGGELACDVSCIFDTRMCVACGNGRVETGEACDGDQLARQSCRSLGYVGGVLACDTSSCEFDVSDCAVCGDGTVQTGENCDGTDLQGQSCDSLGLGSGTLACDPSVCLYDTSGCGTSSGPLCGNGVAERGEECDGDDMLETTCAALGFDKGTLQCNAATCRYNTSGCSFEDPSTGLTCSECREQYCAEVIRLCEEDPYCAPGSACFERCGPEADVMCALDCFNGSVSSAERAVAVLSCTLSMCDAACMGTL